MLKRLLYLALPLAAAALAAGAVTTRLEMQVDRSACDRWVDSVYNSLTERQRVAQLIFPKTMPAQGPGTMATIKRYVQTNDIGGLLFTAGTLEQYAEMTNMAQSLSKVPLLMTFDGEWGLAMRINGAPKYPNNMACGAANDTALMYRYGLEMGRQCRLAGQHVNFAPVLDVNSNPLNPVIGYRSFGEDPQRVAALGVAFSHGLEDGGTQSCGKHFPGHGDTSTDSHKEMTVVNHSQHTLEKVDLVPFQRYIDEGLSGIMTGHIVVRALDPSGRPASLSNPITTGLLRDKMGFEGLIYTDALGMKGARIEGINGAVEALRAGADVLLSSLDPVGDIDIIYKKVLDGSIPRSIIEDRCKRVLRYKYILGLPQQKPVEIDGLMERINSPQCQATIEALCRKAITALRNERNTLPLGSLANSSIAVVNIGTPGDSLFAETCRKYADVDVYSTLGALGKADLNNILAHDVVIAAVFNDNAEARAAFGQLTAAKSFVAAFLTTPYKMNKFRGALDETDALLLCYDNMPHMRRAAAEAIFGGAEVSGTLPVNLQHTAKMGAGIRINKTRLGYSSPTAHGMNPSLTDSIDSLVNRAISAGAFPGAQVIVGHGGDIVVDRCYGTLTAGGTAVTPNTLYDLASVSKAAGTLPGIMKAVDLGLIAVDDSLATFIAPLQGSAKGSLRLRDLLYHESGMPAALNMYNVMFDTASFSGPLTVAQRDATHNIAITRNFWGNDSARIRADIVSPVRTDSTPIEAAEGMWVGRAARDTVMQRIYDIPLRASHAYNYSCLNFCLLLNAEENATGQPHDRWVTDSIWAPLGAYGACYRPRTSHNTADIAPTEYDSFLRRQTVRGFVHDETAAMMGGVSGNAGMFASATDLAKLCQMWLNGGRYGDAQVLSPETVKLFTTAKSTTCRRGLGFDKPDTANPASSPTCAEADASVYGHLGFTGTVFWVDPANDLFFIFLTNRVNPSRDNAAFNQSNIRPELFRQVYLSLEK